MNEVEAKLIVDDDPKAATRIRETLSRAGLRLGPATVRKTTDTYFDTREWDLFRYGWTCRVRRGDKASVLALKKRGHSTNGIARREELESAVEVPPRHPADMPEGPMRTVCEEAAAGRSFEPLFSVEKIRYAYDVISTTGWKAKAAFDEVSQVAGKRKGAFKYREFELEMVEGSEESLGSVCELLEKSLALTPARLNKFERGVHRVNPSIVGEQQELPFEKDVTAAGLARAYLDRCFSDMLREEPRAWEGIDTEGVHQMRVAIRRLRTALKTLPDLFPERTVRLIRRDLTWVANALGTVRDLDVYLGSVRGYAAELRGSDLQALTPYIEFLSQARVQARRRMIRVLASRRYANLKQRIDRMLMNGPRKSAAGHSSAKSVAQKTVLKVARKLKGDGDTLRPKCPNEALHALRIRGKRLRYVLELFAPILGSRVEPTIRAVKKLQDCLGRHHDACVADEKLRIYAESLPMGSKNRGLLLALGELIHIQQLAAEGSRKSFFKLWPRVSQEVKSSHLRKRRLA